jgi:hypothetical protein
MADNTAVSLQVERLRQAAARWHTARVRATWTLVLYVPALAIPWPIPFASSLFIIASVLLVLYGAQALHSQVLTCPHCGGLTKIDCFWVCGFCSLEHFTRQVFFGHTFVERCARSNCGKQAVSFICWTCREPITFNEDAYRRETISAYHPDYPPLTTKKPAEPPRPLPIHRR